MSESFSKSTEVPSQLLIEGYNRKRIETGQEFESIYSQYDRDMQLVEQLDQKYSATSPDAQMGKIAEALIFDILTKHEINNHLLIRPTSQYDDYCHGADLLIEPRNSPVQAVAALDITINQQDIKGLARQFGPAAETRPVGLEKKLFRSREYTDYISAIDSTKARDLSAWIQSGGLHERRDNNSEQFFRDVEKLFLLKYYVSPENAEDPGKLGNVIGGPQAIISIDQLFVNKALQGDKGAKQLIGDLSVLEFAYCIEAEQDYLDRKVKEGKHKNIFFDTHYSKVKAWSNIFKKPELQELTGHMVSKNQGTREFREQLRYYANTFTKVFK
jgi:hypothetical protein